jgi:hypothetical protein
LPARRSNEDFLRDKLLGESVVGYGWDLRGAVRSTNMSQLDTTLQQDTMASDSISPDIPSTIAIPAIDANDSTFNFVGRDQIITNIYNVDPNCNQGIGSINHKTLLNSSFV